MVLILGDSWSCGEWVQPNNPGPFTPEIIKHNGFAQYFVEDGVEALNLSWPGGSLGQVTKILLNFLHCNKSTVSKISHIFVFQTEWTRSFESLSVISQKHEIIKNYYRELNHIGEEFDKNIYLIGGLSDVIIYPNFLQNYPRLIVACQSGINLVLHNEPNVDDPVLGVDFPLGLVKTMKHGAGLEEMQEIVHDLDLAAKRSSTITNQDIGYFSGCHGNRVFHKKIYEYVKTNYFKGN